MYFLQYSFDIGNDYAYSEYVSRRTFITILHFYYKFNFNNFISTISIGVVNRNV